jgi:methionyl-tRNA synthetase
MESFISNPTVVFLILAWTLPWKAVALWRSAKNSQKKWFVVMLILNTLAILEIVYIFYFSKPKEKIGGR